MKCDLLPIVRYTWPGKNEAYACVIHAQQLQNVAQAMGLHLQFIPLIYGHWDATCSQNVLNNPQPQEAKK